jgi:hypothetical protein
VTCRIEGHPAASRTYGDKGEFIDEILESFGARFSTGDPFRPVNIRGGYADGDTRLPCPLASCPSRNGALRAQHDRAAGPSVCGA